MSNYTPGREAVVAKGWLAANKWLLARRFSQLGILALFLAGPLAGWWIVKGTLASSLTLDVLPLTDPFMALQALAANHVLETTGLIGVAIVVAFYLVVGGRTYCSWVCPVNIVTDTAHWARQKLGIRGGVRLARQTRYWVMGMAVAVSAATGVLAWELVNPITILHRGMLFGVGFAWAVVLAVFLYDLFVARRGWCSHLCPVGAFYSLVGVGSLVRVSAHKRSACNNCNDCFAVCPEPHVITPALRGADKGIGPVIRSSDCTNCGRCIDVCAPDVFRFTSRFDQRVDGEGTTKTPDVREAA